MKLAGIYVCMLEKYTYIRINIYIEREREREREIKKNADLLQDETNGIFMVSFHLCA